MKKLLTLLIIVTAFSFSCDLIDGTNVQNPNLTLDEAASQDNAAKSWVNGLKQRTAILYNDLVVVAELTSDNYVNKASYFNQNVDNGTFRDTDTDFNDVARNVGKLREQALFGLSTILENDTNAKGTELEAEMHFYNGWSHLIAGEYFTSLPAEKIGAPKSPNDHFQLAIDAFTKANSVVPNTSYDLALARVYYNMGNKTQAVSFANKVITADDEFVRYVEYDGINGPTNEMEDAVYSRQSFNDLQPLPRLDFLDPKYGDLGGTTESPIALQKAEEAYLIVAEAQLKDSQLPNAKITLTNLLTLVDSRPKRDIDDTEEGRKGTAGVEVRPNASTFIVRVSATRPFLSNLVLDRTATTNIPTLSGTSLDAADIIAAPNMDETLRLVYLLRQEIFFGEARRMVDLGVRWPVSEIEALNNTSVTDADRKPVIPSYIPSNYGDMDAFTVSGNEVTITVDMNEVLATQKKNQFD
ncbi:MAG: hypothetical protein WC967_09075 [Balneolaceae bacterium]